MTFGFMDLLPRLLPGVLNVPELFLPEGVFLNVSCPFLPAIDSLVWILTFKPGVTELVCFALPISLGACGTLIFDCDFS